MAKEYEYALKDYLNGINLKQGNIHEDERAMRKYPAFVVNKLLSDHIDCIMHVNEMNKFYSLDNDLQYSYYLYSIRKSKRFSPWNKKSTDSDLEVVKQFYGYSTEKAKTALRMLNKDQLDVIKASLDVGGKR
ncbi:clamp loader subunit [Synechococcus phage S-SZBM1]|uniref:Clamp loader subunit n=1 Tax=Synechococcus phage S-SZBM1 TaxID=2926475 RepID=A0AC61TSR6_9CAUD|nr:clamp loader subunit [Synechococcus phage S-SZBM1]UNH61272.1 clamp loader subunit [Synechococcus phage S-SZBM1]